MSLRDRLNEILPSLLPEYPEEAIKGRELIARVRAVLGDSYSDHSLRSQFSFIALDPASCLARVPNGQGYYLRRPGGEDALQSMFSGDARALQGADSPQLKRLSLAVRLYDTAGMGVFVFPPEEESWAHPDLVAVQWPAGHREADGAYVMEDAEGAASLRAVCLAAAGDAESLRRALFRTLACGLWAQECELLLLTEEPQEDAEMPADLAARFGVGLRRLTLDAYTMKDLPRADALLHMTAAEARALLAELPQELMAHPRRREGGLDAAGAALPVTPAVRRWVAYCLHRGRIEAAEQRVALS